MEDISTVMLRERYSDLERDRQAGIWEDDDYRRQRNRISKDMLGE